MPPKPKAPGKVIVVGLVTLIVGAVGTAQVYLPYFSEMGQQRRGNAGMGPSSKEMKEAAQNRKNMEERIRKEKGGLKAGSMWDNLNRRSGN